MCMNDDYAKANIEEQERKNRRNKATFQSQSSGNPGNASIGDNGSTQGANKS